MYVVQGYYPQRWDWEKKRRHVHHDCTEKPSPNNTIIHLVLTHGPSPVMGPMQSPSLIGLGRNPTGELADVLASCGFVGLNGPGLTLSPKRDHWNG